MKNPITNCFKYLFIVVLALCSGTVFAGVRLPAIFGDNMILQRNMRVPIYGWAEIGEKIDIEFMSNTYKTITGTDGKWFVKLGSYKAGGPYEMRIGSKSFTLTLRNILIGDVWLAAGQSNMEFGIQTEQHGAEAIAKATDKEIHFFYVPMAQALQTQQSIAKVPADSFNGKWVVCSPELLANPQFAWHGFSAIGFYFAQHLRKSTGVPVGMIGSYKGGTPAQAWISLEGLQNSPPFTKYVDAHQKLVDNYESSKETYPQKLAAYQDSLKIWNTEVGNDFAIVLKKWDADVLQARSSGQVPPIRPKPVRPAPHAPADPEGGFGTPTNDYNGMISPILRYGIKGVIWYQGEGNGDKLADAIEYKDLFPRLIYDWRTQWEQGDFPFLFVQLPNFRDPAVSPSEGNWAWVREAQLKTLSLPATGMPVITDAGDAFNIHPTNKVDPAYRLALVARHVAYNENLVYSGPVYKSMKIAGNKIIISFDEINKGLITGRPSLDGTAATAVKELKGFGIAGSDQKFVWAKAVIDGNTVVVSNDEVANPIAVRYNWADNPPGNLYNKDGLPAGPFRTDNWPPPIRVMH
ncbi:sialate O-acetylesterase [Mucilaginibacter sp.]|uniref:sialate O-acetylesterase n=1 Tax=Mucilaginibacter sp. TaxID=1882438 RepID=UPI0026274CE9|nr:sialate O-acetylesterase [Mucilaginibacter sp.]MDB4925173.1 9-O-acetylesterase [Mucilaginibacter sp.]